MKELFGEIEMNLEQANWVALAMLRVAEAEHGVHVHEQEMIEEFYRGNCQEGGGGIKSLDVNNWDGAAAAKSLSTPELRDVLLLSCLSLGYAHGSCTEAELAAIRTIARELGVDEAHVAVLDRRVKRSLLSEFEDIKLFRDARYDIGRSLGLSASEVDEILR